MSIITVTIPDYNQSAIRAAKAFFDALVNESDALADGCTGKECESVPTFTVVERPVDFTPPVHPTTESLTAGHGIPGFDGVPFDPTPPLTSTPFTPVVPVVVPVPPATRPPASATLDSEGLPWDRRIHASTKTFRQSDGTWKLIRGVDEAQVKRVKGELCAAMGQAEAPAPLPLDNEPGWPAPPPAATIPHLTVVPPPAPPAADPFPEFVQFCTSAQQSGRLKYEQIVETCGKHAITQLPMLNARHDLIPVIRAELEALCTP
jgi:hypothetical protein